MSNPGNTGQRYKMAKVTGVEVQGKEVRVQLDCGHDYSTSPMWVPVEQLAEMIKERIGKRERCNRCQIKQ